MLTIVLTTDIANRIENALIRSRHREVGGVLMAEHTGLNHFTIREITIHRRGAIASFVRNLGEAISGIRNFFHRTNYEYTKFNYLGEWHSHPLFPSEPSTQDDSSMREIVGDPSVGATFAVLLIVKLSSSGNLVGTVHTYLPNGTKQRSILTLEGV